MSARVLVFPVKKALNKARPDSEPPNETCYYSDSELHQIMQDLIDSGHKYLVEVNLIACRDYWTQKGGQTE